MLGGVLVYLFTVRDLVHKAAIRITTDKAPRLKQRSNKQTFLPRLGRAHTPRRASHTLNYPISTQVRKQSFMSFDELEGQVPEDVLHDEL